MNNIIDVISREKLIVIVRGVSSGSLPFLTEAMLKGGIRLLEVTYSADKKISDAETAANISALNKSFGDEMLIGAGTVLSTPQVLLTAESGGSYIISPDTDIDVIKFTKESGLVSIPGAVTPSEIKAAHSAGADFVKLFPAVNLGPEYIRAVSAPLSHIKLLAVGGIDLGNIKKYLSAGACGFGIGSNIVDKKLIEDGNYAAITELAKRYVDAVRG